MYTNDSLAKNLIDLFNKGATVFLSNGSLKIEDSSKVLTAQEINTLKENKSKILSFFVDQNISSSSQIGPLSLQQQRLWLIEKIEVEQAQYNLPGILDLTGELDAVAVETSLRTILNRHDVLRSVYYEEGYEVYQLVRNVSDDKLVEVVDLSHLADGEKADQLKALTDRESRHVFDLATELPLRAVLIQKASDQFTLLLTMHHICGDAWSATILFDEFTTLYSNIVKGIGKPLAELSIQYIDYADWQREWLKEDSVQHDLDYWVNRLSGLPQVHSITLDKPRPIIQDVEAGHYWLDVGPELEPEIEAFCQQHKVTPFILLQTVFSCLLQRYSGQSDIVMGTPTANRERSEFSELIGFFVNTLALRTDLSDNPSFEALLKQNKANILDDFEHQALPFEFLVERLKPERSLSFTPLFQIMFSFQSHKRKDLHLPGLEACTPKQGYTASKFDLTFEVIQNEEGLLFHWEYASAVLGEQTIKRMANHYLTLLKAATKAPKSDIASLALLSEQERQQLLVQWNDTSIDWPKDKCMHELFENQVIEKPNAVAAVFEDQQLTYRELNEKANRLAHYLISEKQITPDTLVGICVDRSLEMVVGLLGILKAGGAYVPLDPQYPDARLQYMLDDAQLTTVLTQKHLQNNTPVSLEQAVYLDDEALLQQLQGQPTTNPNLSESNFGETRVGSKNLAYVIYTSGSTGNPKGVMIEHGSVVNFLITMGDQPGICADDTLLAVTSISFDIHGLELYLPLINGAKLLVASTPVSMDPEALLGLMSEHDVSIMQATPATWKMLVETDWAPASKIKVLCGGEALSHTLAMDLLGREHVELWNMYGPTETTIWSATKQICIDDETILMGKPIGNTQIYITTDSVSLSPIGVAGELHIGGAGLARGYLNRDDLTSEKFIANPFYDSSNPSSSELIYKTGDLTRLLPDGNIEYLGRIDHQVKIRGFRIELGEIENSLIGLDEVKDAVVVAKDDKADNKYIAAYVVADEKVDDHSTLLDALRHSLATSLPDYMVPSSFVFLDVLPLTPNGKVDRKALPEPDASEQQQHYVAPSTDIEKTLCAIWQEVLGIERIGVKDNFFHLGGHSLLATRLVAQVNQVFNVVLPLKSLFSHPILEALARELLSLDTTLASPALTRVSRDGPIQASFTQQRLWLLDQIEGGSSHYNMPGALRLTGVLNVDALNDTFTSIIERHESLRTCFVAGDDGQPVQVIQKAAPFILPVTDLSELDEGTCQLEISERVADESKRMFDLSADLMLRAQLISIAADQHVLLVSMHHIASDGWSMTILINELSVLYSAYAQGEKENPLIPLNIQYADYADWQRNWLQGEVLDKQLGYWSRQLASLPVVHSLPLDYLRPSMQGHAGSTYFSHIDPAISQSLTEVCKTQNATLFMGLHAAFSTLLGLYSNETDVVMGSPIANREQAEVADMIGFFVNTLVLRSDLSDNPSFIELLNQSKAMLLDAYANQQVPFEKIVEDLQPERSLSHSPLFQVMLVLQNNDEGTLELPGLSLSPLNEEGTNVAKFDLTLTVTQSDDGLSLGWTYNTDLFKAQTIERMTRHFGALLTSLLSKPNESVFKAKMLSGQERHQLLTEWNDTSADYPKDKCVHELFEAHVKSSPDAVAVIVADQQLTYRELNQHANQLAHYLITQKQVKTDTLVGICVERSLEMVIGIMAILKAGGAYVPLDPEYPPARLQYMLDDANLTTVLTQTHLREVIPVNDDQAVCFDDQAVQRQLESQQTHNPDTKQLGLNSSNLAYVIYTSGSTGNPKGVMIEHRSLVNYLYSLLEPCSDISGSFVNTNICFDGTATSFWFPFVFGKYTKLSTSSSADSLSELIDEVSNAHEPILFKITPAHLDVFSSIEKNIGNGVKHSIFVGGEAFLTQKYKGLPEGLKSSNMFNHYGPSEGTVGCSYFPIDPNHITPSHSIPLGKPVNNAALLVLSPDYMLCPTGLVGELHIGGDGLARGYLNRPDLTDEKFISNPFFDKANPTSSDRLYKTGDLVRWLPSGNLEFVGRIDHQVKIRGFRVELGEIESALSMHEAVKDAVVLDVESNVTNSKQLVAYIVTEPIDEDTVQQELVEFLRDHLSQTLPDYMVPSAFVLLDSLPLTPNGKMDRKALPAPDLSTQQKSYVAPSTEPEKILCEILQELLGLEKLGVNDNFFHLGGDSLLVMALIVKIKEHGFTIQPKDVFSTQTIGKISKALKDISTLTLLDDSISRLGVIPLTPWQKGLLIKHEGNKINGYNISQYNELDGSFNPEKLSLAFKQVVLKHDALRLKINRNGSTFSAEITEHGSDVGVDFLDLSGFDTEEHDSIASEFLRKKHRIDVAKSQLIQVALFKKGLNKSDYLYLTVNHLVGDGYSVNIIYEDLITAYKQIESGQDVVLPCVSTSAMFAANQIDSFCKSEASKKELEYWTSLPFNSIAEHKPDYSGVNNAQITSGQKFIWRHVSKEQTQSLMKFLSEFVGSSMADILVLLAVEAQRCWLGGEYFRVNVINNGRNILEDEFYTDLSRVVGYFNLTKLFILKGRDFDSGIDYLRYMLNQIDSVPTKGVGLRYLINGSDEMKNHRQLEPLTHYLKTPKVISLQYYGVVDGGDTVGIKPDVETRVTNVNRIGIEAQITNGSLQFLWTYNDNVYKEETMKRIVLSANNLLDKILDELEVKKPMPEMSNVMSH